VRPGHQADGWRYRLCPEVLATRYTAMPDPTVARWKLRGRVCLWRYRTLGPRWHGWHLAADTEGCASLLELLDLMQRARFSSRATLPLTEPPEAVLDVPNRDTYDARPATSWTLIHPKRVTEPRTWELSSSGTAVTLRFGSDYFPVLRKAIVDLSERTGDYAIGTERPDATWIWVWWWSPHAGR
jgi:hypothetical protein